MYLVHIDGLLVVFYIDFKIVQKVTPFSVGQSPVAAPLAQLPRPALLLLLPLEHPLRPHLLSL